MKRLLIAAALVLLTSAAHAGDASCGGNLTIGPEWSTIQDTNYVCRFKTQSATGRSILSICRAGIFCQIGLTFDGRTDPDRQGVHADYTVRGRVWTITGKPWEIVGPESD